MKYELRIWAAMNTHGSGIDEVADLVGDLGFTEQQAAFVIEQTKAGLELDAEIENALKDYIFNQSGFEFGWSINDGSCES